MVYVTTDLHGRYDKYTALLEKIHFSDSDKLYVLGDACDLGLDTGPLYLDLLRRDNVYCIMGNHEKMLLEALPKSFGFLQKDYGHLATMHYDLWSACGGNATCASFMELSEEEIAAIYHFILSLPFYRSITVNGKNFLLVHAGLDNYERTKPLDEYYPEELACYDFDHDGTYYPTLYHKIIVGHTPTFTLHPDSSSTIYHSKKGNVVCVDCGAVFEADGGQLGCLWRDTMEEEYV